MAAAAAKKTKSAAVKKESNTKKVAEVVAPIVEEAPSRVTRRNAPVKAATTAKKGAKKASPTPSPAPSKPLKSKKKAAEKKEKIDSEEAPMGVAHSQVSKKAAAPSCSKGSCCKKLINGYLIIYNSISAVAWAYLLFNLARSFFVDDHHNYKVLFGKTGHYLAYLQTVALLEVLHAAFGWVRSGVLSNVIQIASRLFVIWGAAVYSGSAEHWAYGMMATAWAFSDFTRYAYYLTQLTGISVPVLKWARYNFFLVLYPVGTLGEAILLFLARLKWLDDFIISSTLLVVLSIYTPGFLYMYSHMLQQRAKHFAPDTTGSVSAPAVKLQSGRKTKTK